MELEPKSGPLSSQALALSGNGYVLAGEATANKVNCCNVVSGNISHVLVAWHAGPVLCQHRPRRCVNLNLPSAFHPGLLEAKIETRRYR
jgi:hypothetical protein